MPIPPNPDIIAYPVTDPTLIVSVSETPLDFEVGLDAPLDLYVETLSIDLTGEDGTKDEMNGYRGGTIELYVEHIGAKDVDSLLLKGNMTFPAICGGDGLSHDSAFGADTDTGGENDGDGGDGGEGGTVSVLFGSIVGEAYRKAIQVITDLSVSSKKFPSDFQSITNELVEACGTKEMKRAFDLSENFAKMQNDLKSSDRDDFRDDVIGILKNFSIIDDDKVTGGHGGKARSGGMNGKPGKDGTWSVKSILNSEAIWDCYICFVHPLQCRMLLDKARLYYYVDGDENRAKCMIILWRLRDRLLFLDHRPKDVGNEPKLITAYKKAELRIFIPRAEEGAELASISDLQAIKDEVNGVLTQLNSGKDYYGYDEYEAPPRRYEAYRSIIFDSLESLKEAETYYTEYVNHSKKEEERTSYLSRAKAACDTTKASNNRLIKLAKEEMKGRMVQIKSFTNPMKKMSGDLTTEVGYIKSDIKGHSGVLFSDLLQALGQVFMVQTMPMAVLQGVGLLNESQSKIPDEMGVEYDKTWLLDNVSNISGELDSIYEGYVISKVGKIDLLDPGAAKLQITANKLVTLLSNYNNILKDQTAELKKILQDYVDLVLKRNAAVVRYNSCLAVIVKCYTENLAQNKVIENLANVERQTVLTMDSPTMTVAMKKIYVAELQKIQGWLYKAQRAYNFEALNSTNVLGQFFCSVDMSQYTYGLVKAAHQSLFQAYNEYLDEYTGSRQPFFSLQYILGEDDVRSIKFDSQDSALLHLRIAPPDPEDTNSPFSNMVDIRLTRVRLFLPNVTTDDGKLQVSLTHLGDETLVDTKNTQITFSHKTYPVNFIYDIATSKPTIDGVVGNVDDPKWYALPGPFATWEINIPKNCNPGLVLTEIEKPYLEFDGVYRPITPTE
ncbi:uncharacterized protein EAE97_008158 [Botrytis byssoidea]|uniref:Uncharacterized protein n=1 Tax=Botrytis byssoidea TaxID=139641 RepID=A0A9P5LU81_9HELO|nr:uncharacterized protein EAE97_008158 [Botrytis byssoidea]KAF7935251.1 hypothetical protein EAE97_008158 [Botrytis byssoidea]